MSSAAASARRTGTAVAAAFGALHTIAYALWFGGIITIGALLAPVVAGVIHQPPAGLDPGLLKLTLTKGIIGQTLKNFNIVCYVCGFLMLTADGVELIIHPSAVKRIIILVRFVATLSLLATVWYLAQVLTPRMDLMLAQQNMTLFDSLHKQYENIVIMYQTPILLIIPVLTAIRNAR